MNLITSKNFDLITTGLKRIVKEKGTTYLGQIIVYYELSSEQIKNIVNILNRPIYYDHKAQNETITTPCLVLFTKNQWKYTDNLPDNLDPKDFTRLY